MTCEIDFRTSGESVSHRLIWLTDLHLDAADRTQCRQFFDLLRAYEPDIILVGGDISNGLNSLMHLENLEKLFHKQCYFVLGNHDFYYGSIDKTRALAQQLTKEHPLLHYLTDNGIIPLTNTCALIGHDGWSDGKAGDFLNSSVMLNDYFLIEELKRLNPEERLLKLNALGIEAATFLQNKLIEAFETFDRVIILTHVPPFVESCLYDGLPCDENWSPHFVGHSTGVVLEQVMAAYPAKQLLVLCGHSHWGQDIQILTNLRVVTGHSELGFPSVQGVVFC